MIILLSAMSIFTLTACAEEPANNARLTANSYVRDIINHPAFKGFGECLLPRNDNSAYFMHKKIAKKNSIKKFTRMRYSPTTNLFLPDCFALYKALSASSISCVCT